MHSIVYNWLWTILMQFYFIIACYTANSYQKWWAISLVPTVRIVIGSFLSLHFSGSICWLSVAFSYFIGLSGLCIECISSTVLQNWVGFWWWLSALLIFLFERILISMFVIIVSLLYLAVFPMFKFKLHKCLYLLRYQHLTWLARRRSNTSQYPQKIEYSTLTSASNLLVKTC